MTKTIIVDQPISYEYAGTGTQEELLVNPNTSYRINGTIAVKGTDAADDFAIQEKIGGIWHTSFESTSGEIRPQRISGKTEGFRLSITTNTAGITLSLLF